MTTLILIATILLSLLALGTVIYIIYIQLIPGAFYYPSAPDRVKTIFDNIKISAKDTVIDLGSGDGRLLIAAAQCGAKAIGYEMNPALVHQSRQKIENLKLSNLIKIKAKNFWHANLTPATIICVYQFPKYIKKLEKILKKSKHPVTVISNNYPFPNQKPYLIKNKIYFYKFP
jgi:16S rRNA A1518/A1519 N6-dimethyltransferase RsmA/KsgA/DIM1 with predicted DNA glycosylase/AP lyase activity